MPNRASLTVCPHLGLAEDSTVTAMSPTAGHRCYAQAPSFTPEFEHQQNFCLSDNCVKCVFYVEPTPGRKPAADLASVSQRRRNRRRPRMSVLAVLPILLGLVFILLVLSSRAFRPDDEDVVLADSTPQFVTDMPAVPTEPTATDTPVSLIPTPTPGENQLIADQVLQPTPEEGAQELTIVPKSGDAGWWSSEEGDRLSYLGDSYLYGGAFGGQSYISAVRFDLEEVPRGAAIRAASLTLTGLRADRFNSDTRVVWLAQFVPESALPDLTAASFLDLYGAPGAVTLLPNVESSALAEGAVTSWTLDDATRRWIVQQRIDGAATLTLRIIGSTEGDSLFAWDSGLGPESKGDAPTLKLSVGPPPPTPPAMPTFDLVIATATPTPANQETAVVRAATATAYSAQVGTPTPLSGRLVTPTPTAASLEAVQTLAIINGQPPVLVDTPVPANAATVEALSVYATAVALTTGTFTPVPANYVTPMIYYPPPPPENVLTAAARSAVATANAEAGLSTEGTPMPYNALAAVYAFATETPANQSTAAAIVQRMNADAVTTGTPTPTPFNLVVITLQPLPTATPIPPIPTLELAVDPTVVTATPTATPTRIILTSDLALFSGKILFLSDRGGSAQTYAMDPATGEVVAFVTENRLHQMARQQYLSFSPDGVKQAVVLEDSNRVLQIQVQDSNFGTNRQLTTYPEGVMTYDPTWSPRGDLIAFVSNAVDGDEIYVVDPEGTTITRLTSNAWAWDKHPTWSPDGSQIAFYSNRETGRRQIWVMNVDGSGARNLSNNEYEDWDPVWVR